MKLTQISACVALALTCTSCSLTPKEANTSSIRFNYKVENALSNGVVQIFDMDGNTLVQIKNIRLRTPVFLDESNREINYEIIGETAKLVGTHKKFSIVANGVTSNVIRKVDKREEGTVSSSPEPNLSDKYKTVSEEELRIEIERMKKEHNDLRSFIGQGTPDSTSALQAKSPQLGTAKNPLIISFQDNSATFDPKPEQRVELIKLAKESNEISIKGFTDATVVNNITTSLAKSRALAAKNWLVANGTPAKKITLSFEASGHFIADNKTKEGKAKNRRVEIQASQS